ncbi:MAG: hypothetical protein C4570_06435 [Ammonifex sp.]|jgi:hypothetical protein|nr:MAG: hypothetical protein C4570_06435 [Ammonifex sp.]
MLKWLHNPKRRFQLLNEPPGGGGQGGGGGNPPAQTFTAEYVRDLRQEAAEYRSKLRDAEKDRDTAKTELQALKTGTDALLERARQVLKLDANADLKAVTAKIEELAKNADGIIGKAQEALRKAVFVAAATKSNLIDIEAAYKLADLTGVNVDMESMNVFPVDKDGKQLVKDGKPVSGLDHIVEALVKEKPYLAGKTGSGGVGSSSNPGAGGPPDPVAEAKKIAEERNKGAQQAPGGLDPWAPKQ